LFLYSAEALPNPVIERIIQNNLDGEFSH
jgi:hypothetical protein